MSITLWLVLQLGFHSSRCHPWRRPGARASPARGSSSSAAASTSSASCAPTATPTPRSTTATTSSDTRHRFDLSCSRDRARDLEPHSADIRHADLGCLRDRGRDHGPNCARDRERDHGPHSSDRDLNCLRDRGRENGPHSSDTRHADLECLRDRGRELGAHSSDTDRCDRDLNYLRDRGIVHRPYTSDTLDCLRDRDRDHGSHCSRSMERDGLNSSRQNPNSSRGRELDHLLGDHDRGDCPRHPRQHSRIEERHKDLDSNYSQGDCPRHPRRQSHIEERFSSLSSRSVDRVAKHSIFSQRNFSRIDECPSNLSNSSRDRFDPKLSEVTYRCGHTARLNLDTKDSYHESLNRFGLSLKFGQRPNEASRSHLYNTNTLSADYANVGHSFAEFSARISGSSSKASNGPHLDSKRKVNPSRRYSLNFSDFCSEMAFRRNDGRASSWSLSNINASSSHTPRSEAQPGIHRPYAIKIPSADNIRQLQKDWNMSKDKLKPSTSNAHLLEDINNAICCQPRENKNKFSVQNLDTKRESNSASSVHWTNSVENRVCCPETVLYGAVYGLKCLK